MNRLEQSFEDKYQADHRDPMVAEELRHFTMGWNALSEQTPQISRLEASEIACDAAIRYANGQVIDWEAEFSVQQGCVDREALEARSDAWFAVVDALNTALGKDWIKTGANGMESAVSAIATLSAQQAGTGEPTCPRCLGSGEQQYMTWHRGPDDYEVAGQCSECGGTGATPKAAPEAVSATVPSQPSTDVPMPDGSMFCPESTDGAKLGGDNLFRLWTLAPSLSFDEWSALAAAPENTSEKCNSQGATLASADGEEHPTNRYLFKRLCEAHGIVLGQDNIARALKKIKVAPEGAPKPVAPAVTIDFRQATDLLDMFGGQPAEIMLEVVADRSEGITPGLYAWHADCPEEGSVNLGVTDGEAIPSAAGQDVAAFIRNLLWDDHLECCGCPVVGAEYMGQQEQVCCGCPEPSLLNDKQIVASLRARFPEAPRAAGQEDAS